MTVNPILNSYSLWLADPNSGKIAWSVQSKDIELVAGMLAAGIGIMDDLNTEQGTQYYVDSDADVSAYRLVDSITEGLIEANTCGRLQSGQYGLWMKSYRRFYYNLYGFTKPSFFQGIVSMCNSFEVDFRNYIYGLPFDRNGKQYALSGYVMTDYRVAQDAPDLDDVEEEEQDDENIIEPLPRDDELRN